MSNHLTFLLLRSDCGGSITFPTAWIVGKERPQSRLYLDREYKMCFAQANLGTNLKNLLAWSACTEQMAEFFEGSHFALFCFTKSTHFFRLFFRLWPIVTKILNRVKRYSIF